MKRPATIRHAVKGNPEEPDTVIMVARCGARAPYMSLTCNPAFVTCLVCLDALRRDGLLAPTS